ncbi:MAG: pitrilysin family protein [Gemmatimonadota bacterium]|nr:pitrilysin family protein [Gemmatimonadota bacterium]
MAQGNGRQTPRFRIERRTLDNGLRVLVQPGGEAPLVAAHMMYDVGSADEPAGRRGFAHLFEHLLFEGSEHVAKGEHFRLVQAAGGTLNGTTWFDRTNYWETVPVGELELALWLESDRMGWFLPALTQEKLDNQRDVVKNERRQSYENRPYGLAVETALARLFPAGHPYRHPTIGFMEDLDAATLTDARDWFETWYGPENATLVIAGAVAPDAAFAAADRWFGAIPSRGAPRGDRAAATARGEGGVVTIGDRVSAARVYLACHAPAFPDPAFEAADVLSSLLAEGRSSRLHHDLVHERRIAAGVGASAWPLRRTGLVWIVVTGLSGVPASELDGATREVLDRLVREGPREFELEGARNRARRQLVLQLDSVTQRADALAHAAVLRGDPDYLNEVFARYDAVSADDVARVSHDILAAGGPAAVHVVPEGDGR